MRIADFQDFGCHQRRLFFMREMSEAGTTRYNTNAVQGQAPVLAPYGQVTSNIVLNFVGMKRLRSAIAIRRIFKGLSRLFQNSLLEFSDFPG